MALLKGISSGTYYIFPLISTLMWFATLLSLLLLWIYQDDRRMYQRDEPSIVFISDTGAAHKKLFIGGCVVTSSFYVLSLLAERWLRHADRLPGAGRKRERWCDILAIIFGTIGAIALIMLSIFDAFNHSTVHWSMTLVFIVGVALSAIFQTAEVHFLDISHPDRAHLRRNAWLKIGIVTVAVVLAICFGGTYAVCGGDAGPGKQSKCNAVSSAAAVFEWAVAFVTMLYWATFILDLWPAAKTSPRYLRQQEKKLREKGHIAPQYGNSSLSLPPPMANSNVRHSQETYSSNVPLRQV